MIVSANIATTKSRLDVLKKTIESLKDQVDVIRVYANDYDPTDEFEASESLVLMTGEDLTDNAKFYWANEKRDEYYLTCDDDILYPSDYVERMLFKIKQFNGCYISFHGRILKSKGVSYYRGDHKIFSCLREVKGDWRGDVAGTGVGGFDLRDFQVDASKWKYGKMSDLMIGLDLVERGIPIILADHRIFWLKDQGEFGIYHEVKDDSRQTEVADKILTKKQ